MTFSHSTFFKGVPDVNLHNEQAGKKSPNPVDRHVGTKVRMRRILLGMTQEKLGEALGLTFQQIQKYEKGTNRIGASRLQQISTTLQVPPSFFFAGAPSTDDAADEGADTSVCDAPRASDVLEFIATVEGVRLNKAFAQITDAKVRKRIVELVTTLAGDAQ
jgi:transcriptional regulator with XRE-family HTH domain